MTKISRRAALSGALAASLMAAACGNGVGSNGANMIDTRVLESLGYLDATYPATRDLQDSAAGMLVMPLVTEAGILTVGGSYGRGALLVNGVTVDYYLAASGSLGPQLGAQQFSHVLYFMTDEALQEFRTSPGWVAGGEVQYTAVDVGETLAADTTTAGSPVVAVVYGQQGLIAGATIQGTKYTRIIP